MNQAFEKKKEANAKKDAEQQAQEEEEAAKREDGEESEQEREEGEDEEQELEQEEKEYEVFYNQDQIKNTFYNQQKDVFSDIRFERFDLFNQSDGLTGLKSKNKFTIEDFAPKLPRNEEDMRLKKKAGPSFDEDAMEREAIRLREEELKEKAKQEKIRKAIIDKNAHKI